MATHSKKVLLVEGNDDFHVINHLWRACGLPERFFDTEKCGSDEKLLEGLEIRLSASRDGRPTHLGLVLDADRSDPSQRYSAIKGRLSLDSYKACTNYNPPEELDAEGTIIFPQDTNYPIIGVWVMPDNFSTGMLEDFLAQLAPNKKAMEFAKGCVANAKSKGFSSFKDAHRSKAEIHTYLAWQDEPGNPLGISIDANALDAQLPEARRFIEFLKKLFEMADG